MSNLHIRSTCTANEGCPRRATVRQPVNALSNATITATDTCLRRKTINRSQLYSVCDEYLKILFSFISQICDKSRHNFGTINLVRSTSEHSSRSRAIRERSNLERHRLWHGSSQFSHHNVVFVAEWSCRSIDEIAYRVCVRFEYSPTWQCCP